MPAPLLWYCRRYHYVMPSVARILAEMRANPRNIGRAELAKDCEHHFGAPRTRGGSRAVHTTPWPGDPRVNVQDAQGKAKAHQVKQVLQAMESLEANR